MTFQDFWHWLSNERKAGSAEEERPGVGEVSPEAIVPWNRNKDLLGQT